MARARRGCGYVDYEPIPTCLSISGNTLIYETNTGEVKNVTLPSPFSEVTFNPANCTLTYTNDVGTVNNIQLEDILLKSQDSLVFNSDECTLKYTSVNGDCELWNIGAAFFNKLKDGSSWDADNCVLQQIDTSGNIQSFNLSSIIDKSQTDLNWDAENCILSFQGPTGTDKHFNLTDILDKLCIYTDLAFDPATCVLKFTNPAGACSTWDLGAALANKDQDKCYVHTYDPVTHTITLTETTSGNNVSVTALNCGSLAIDNVNCQLVYTNEKGGKDLIPIAKPSMTTSTDADGNKTFCFSDGYGNTTCCDIPVVNLDTDNMVINGSQVTFTTGGDGNPGTVVFDVCDMVAANCNATFTNINSDGSWSFIDNAGNTFDWAPVITTLTDNGDSFTYVSEDGTVTNVDKCCTTVTQDADFYYITDHNGNQAVVCKNPVKDVVFNGVVYQPDASGSVVLNYEAPEQTQSSLTDNGIDANGVGSFTHTDGAGNSVTVEFCPKCPEVIGAGDVTVTSSTDSGGLTTYTVSYNETLTSISGDPDAGTITYVDEDGNPTVLDLCTLIATCVADQVSEVHIGADEPVKSANGGEAEVWFNCNDGCVYYCQADGSWLAPKGCPIPEPTSDVKIVNGEGTALVADQGLGADAFCVQEPLTTCSIITNECDTFETEVVPFVPKGAEVLTADSVSCENNFLAVGKNQIGATARQTTMSTGSPVAFGFVSTGDELGVIGEHCYPIVTDCAGTFMMVGQIQVGVSTTDRVSSGRTFIVPEISVNGGNWNNGSNGSWSISPIPWVQGGGGPNNGGQFGALQQEWFPSFYFVLNLPACTTCEVCFRLRTAVLNTIVGTLQINQFNMRVQQPELCHKA